MSRRRLILAALVGISCLVGTTVLAFAAPARNANLRLAQPKLEVRPPAATASTSAHFRFRLGTPSTVRFEAGFRRRALAYMCSVDGRRERRCGSARRVTVQLHGLEPGTHRFCVRLRDTSRGPARPARFGSSSCVTWRVMAVTIVGDVTGALMPGGTARPVDLRFTNPSDAKVTVSDVRVDVTGTSSPACSGDNFTATPLQGSIAVPPRATVSLGGLGVATASWPQLRMLETGRNQDACKLQSVRLTYSAKVVGT